MPWKLSSFKGYLFQVLLTDIHVHIVVNTVRPPSKIRTNSVDCSWFDFQAAQQFEIISVLSSVNPHLHFFNLEGNFTVFPFSLHLVGSFSWNSSLLETVHDGNMGSRWISLFCQWTFLKSIWREQLCSYCRILISNLNTGEKVLKEHLEYSFTFQWADIL